MANTVFPSIKTLLLCTLLILPCSTPYISVEMNGTQTSIYHYMKSSVSRNPFSITFILGLWTLLEVAFYFFFVHTRERLQQTTQPAKPLTQSERTRLFWNCLHTIHDLKTWSEGWFYYKQDHSHPQFQDIQRENMAIWFAWAFWHDHLDIVRQTPSWSAELEDMICSAEDWFDYKFPPGLNHNLQCIRLSLDPVQAYHRPFILYAGLYALTTAFNTFCLQWAWQFKHSGTGIVWGGVLVILHNTVEHIKSFIPLASAIDIDVEEKQALKKISYFYQNTTENDQTPLVFLHGIGAGLVFYAEFVHQLTKLNRPLFLVELPYVAMHMVDEVPSAEETVSEITDMLHRFGYDKAVYVSHSLGTGVSSWIMNKAPESVAGVVMIDPICFLLHYHHVAFNFVHRIPKTLFENALHYGAARELYISNYISRHFQWFETIYFSQPSETTQNVVLPAPLDTHGPLANATVFLSEVDGIVSSPAVYTYLKERGVDARMMKGLEHAMFLSNRKWKATISQQINNIARKADKIK